MKVWILVAYGLVQLLIGSSNATPVGTYENARVITVLDSNMDEDLERDVKSIITDMYENNPTGDYIKLIQNAVAENLSNLIWIVIEEPKAQYFGDYLDRPPKYLYLKRDALGYEPAIYLIVGF